MTTGNKQYTKYLRGRQDWTTYPTRVPVIQDPFGTLYFVCGKKWVGSDNPAYQKKIDEQLSATNGYQVEKSALVFAKRAKVKYIITNPSSDGAYTRNFESYGQGLIEPTWDDIGHVANNTNRANISLLKKLNKLQNSYGGLELLGEFRETLHMIKHPAEALATYLNQRAAKLVEQRTSHERRKKAIRGSKKLSDRKISKLLNKEARDFKKLVAATWLEIQFGVAPLLGTLSDMADTSLETFPQEGAVKILQSTSKSFVSIPTTLTNVSFGGATYTEYRIDEYEYTVTLKARVAYTGQYDGMGSLQLLKAKGGFTASQVVPTLWELAPLSVFFDYFANVGDVLTASMTETKDVKSVDRYITRRLLRTSTIVFNDYFTGGLDPLSTKPGKVITTFYKYNREKFTFVKPTLVFTTPADSVAKLLNLSAFIALVIP